MTKLMLLLTMRIPRNRRLPAIVFPVLLACLAIDLPIARQGSTRSADSSVEQIESALAQQDKHWNGKNMEGFMATYWNSDKLTFSGGGKTTRGWQATFDRYKEKYPPEKMGELTFDNQEVTMLGLSSALVLGEWHLKLDSETTDGNFTLVLRKIAGDWKIIHDHSSILSKD